MIEIVATAVLIGFGVTFGAIAATAFLDMLGDIVSTLRRWLSGSAR